MKLFIFITVLIFKTLYIQAQPSYFEVNKPSPNFIIKNVEYFGNKKQVTLQDFKGKWVVLDFWNKYCGACVGSFPRTSRMVQELGDKVQILLIAIEDPENQIRKMYAKYRDRLNLMMPCAFDSAMATKYDIAVCPYVVLIDDKGIVRSVTLSLNTKDIQAFIAGNPPILLNKAYREHEDEEEKTIITYDKKKPFLVDDNGAKENDFLFRSVLTAFNPAIHQSSRMASIKEGVKNGGRFEVLGVGPQTLFEYAYLDSTDHSKIAHLPYGEYHDIPILEVNDSSKFKDLWKYGKNVYSYSLIMPADQCNEQSMQELMQKDLLGYFGCTAGLETRKCTYYKIIAKPGTAEKLKTRGGPSSWQGIPKASFTAKNTSFKDLVDLIKGLNGGSIFYDETGIVGNVDISMDCLLADLDDLKRGLQAVGLDLIEDKKDMTAFVIHERNYKPNTAIAPTVGSATANK